MTIAICASFSFYEHVAQIHDELLALGHIPHSPRIVEQMKQAGNFSKDPLRNTAGEFSDYSQKGTVMREHFDTILQADAILVVNDAKHGQANYIGPNVLTEMAVAFAHHKPIYVFNDVPAKSPFIEEIRGLATIPLKGNLSAIT
jgi:hypothetical protein